MARKVKKLSITLPTKWNDLTPGQVIRVAQFLHDPSDVIEKYIRLAADFADLKIRGTAIDEEGEPLYKFYHRDQGNVIFNAEQIECIVKALGWINGELTLMAAPNLDGYKTPNNKLYGITVEQFVTADSAYNHFAKTQSIDALRTFVASLYPVNSFNPDGLKSEARRMVRLDAQLMGVFLWFTSAKKFLIEKYPLVYGGGAGSEPLSGSEVLLSLQSSLNGGDITKNDSIRAGELHEALHELNLAIKNSQKDA